jgi:hypothetical protein
MAGCGAKGESPPLVSRDPPTYNAPPKDPAASGRLLAAREPNAGLGCR